ncbi:formate dehydrogenase accessory sulfurtransferase FdhD [Mucilaginibacter calamicampi]|uniref:Sulfur carrier protein FdhD n=1 Tax=Mucilaginibacter calamicampi TaxID=1302352 RepID=A0ABW2Z2U9_9SPHI
MIAPTLAPTKHLTITTVKAGEVLQGADVVSIEEPLEIKLDYGPGNDRATKNLSVTMRTPGHDDDLAAGFLFTEGIVNNAGDIEDIFYADRYCAEQKQNSIVVKLVASCLPVLQNADRNFYTTSSCGVCGKGSIEAIRTVSKFGTLNGGDIKVEKNILYQLPAALMEHQHDFSQTGGIHASALFSLSGGLLSLREDVGRHNALDKLIGNALVTGLLPLNNHLLLLSGRASFELVQKAAMAGIRIIAAIGAPSSLAVELAAEFNITLVGFLKSNRFNIYTSPERIV